MRRSWKAARAPALADSHARGAGARAEPEPGGQAEPEPGAPGAAAVAVRLPDASVARRRFAAAADLGAVHAWVACLDGFPRWEPGAWALVTSFPRARLPAEGATLEQALQGGAGGVMLTVERL